jgi:hypothetical protein
MRGGREGRGERGMRGMRGLRGGVKGRRGEVKAWGGVEGRDWEGLEGQKRGWGRHERGHKWEWREGRHEEKVSWGRVRGMGGGLREREAWKQERCHEGSGGMKEGK